MPKWRGDLAVTSGWQKTLHHLARTPNDAAVAVLIPLLDSPHQDIQVAALDALLERRSPGGLHEILRRLNRIRPGWETVLEEKCGRMADTFRDAILGQDRRLAAYACEAVCTFREYDLMPALIAAVEAPANPLADLAGRTIVRLAEQLSEEFDQTPDHRRRDPQFVRRNLVASLESSVERFDRHGRKETLEAYLMLAARENATLKQILLDPTNPCLPDVLRMLRSSDKRGVFRLLLSFLDDPHAPLAALQVIAGRTDQAFVSALLSKVAEAQRTHAFYNFSRLEHLAWAAPERIRELEEFSDIQQAAAVRLIAASGMARSEIVAALAHMALRASVPARRAAVEALADYPVPKADAAIAEALNDPDPHVVARATRQVRGRSLPDALARLISLADHPHEAVRQAVRDSLTEFSFAKYLASFDTLDPDVQRSTGELVRKLDPTTLAGLRAEMASNTRSRRLRAIAMAAAMNLVDDLQDELALMADDRDSIVRVEAIEVLANLNSPAAHDALRLALTDPSPAVQDAARRALHQLIW